MRDDGFYQQNKRVTDDMYPIAVQLCKSHRLDYELRCVARRCQQPGGCATGILVDSQFARREILECAFHVGRRMNDSTPKSDMLATRNSVVVAKRHAITRKAEQEPPRGDTGREADPGTSDVSSSSEMPELDAIENEEVEAAVGKSQEPTSRRSTGSTVCETGANDPTKIEQTVQDLTARQPTRRNSTGSDVPYQSTTYVPSGMKPKAAQSPVQSATNSVFEAAAAD